MRGCVTGGYGMRGYVMSVGRDGSCDTSRSFRRRGRMVLKTYVMGSIGALMKNIM